MDDNFYYQLTHKLRGSSETVIKSLSKKYSKFLEVFSKSLLKKNALDLGCGRGEWLELLTKYDINSIGVDSNINFINDCNNKKLKTKKSDLLEYVKKQKKDSFSLITMFHVCEHLQHDYFLKLMKNLKRILVDGGILIIEVPNPENILVSSKFFYHDPTHIRPITSEYLSFLCEYFNFYRGKKTGFMKKINKSEYNNFSLIDFLQTVDDEYAFYFQKNGKKSLINHFNKFFSAKISEVSIVDSSNIYSDSLTKNYKNFVINSQIELMNNFIPKKNIINLLIEVVKILKSNIYKLIFPLFYLIKNPKRVIFLCIRFILIFKINRRVLNYLFATFGFGLFYKRICLKFIPDIIKKDSLSRDKKKFLEML